MSEHLPVGVQITRIIQETPSIRTFIFNHSFSFQPGQFVMVWIPGVDEIPMALSSDCSITVQKVGEATTALFCLESGDMIGIRGPFGNGFPVSQKSLAIAGGVGSAPLLTLARAGAVELFLIGARTSEDLLFAKEITEYSEIMVATDDGTAGHHGFVVELMDDLDLHGFEQICACGPELMMRSVLNRLDRAGLAERGYFSLNRYMKCGVGVCGSCCIDPGGHRVCRDGPVFSGDLLINSEFGDHIRDASGIKIKFRK